MPISGMDDMQIREFALFLYEENQKTNDLLDDMIVRLDGIGKDLKEARKELKEARMLIYKLSVQNQNAEKFYWNIKL